MAELPSAGSHPWAAARAVLARDLDADERRAQPELAAQNVSRFLALEPLLLLGHGLSMLGSASWHVLGDARSVAFGAHLVTVGLNLGLLGWALAAQRRGARPAAFGDAVVLLYCTFGLVVAANAQRVAASADFLNFALFFTAVLFRARLAAVIPAYLGSSGAFWVALEWVHHDADTRWTVGSTTTAVALVSFGFSRLLVRNDLREVAQRHLIAQQKRELELRGEELERRKDELEARQEELEHLNAALERKVEDQLGELLQRSAEVDALDAQLRAKVRDRAKDLAKALRDAPAQTESLSPGDLFAGRVNIRRLLGAGGMGEVYLGDDLVTGRAVAVKRMRADVRADGAMLARFVAEASAASAVEHPGVVRCLHVDLADDGGLYHLMEYVRGTTLQEAVATGQVDLAAALRLSAALADVLSSAHAAGVVHRDIKPSNVMLTAASPGVRVLDFGISKLSDEPTGATRTGQILGTPRYMAPEQFQGGGETGATDVYALGAVLFELISGRPPFRGGSLLELIRAHVDEVPARLDEIRRDVPEPVASLVAACLAKVAADRPTAGEVAEMLAAQADALGALPVDELSAKLSRAGRLRAAFDFDTVAHELAHAIARPPAPRRPSAAPTALAERRPSSPADGERARERRGGSSRPPAAGPSGPARTGGDSQPPTAPTARERASKPPAKAG